MLNLLRKFFIPTEENEYKPHVFREASVAVLSFVALFIFFAGILQNTLLIKTDLISAVIPKTLIDLANKNRFANRLAVLTPNSALEKAAELKALDMASKGYFSHVSPDGKSPWYWFREAGYKFAYAGENLAVNFADSENVDSAWMASPAHRANILNGKFSEIGIATAKGIYKGKETIFVVQMFGRPLESIPAIAMVQEVEAAGSENESDVSVIPVVFKDEKVAVLGESESFISTKNPAVLDEAIPPNLAAGEAAVPEESTLFEKLITSPSKTVRVIYTGLIVFILVALGLMIFIEIRRQHPLNIFYGVILVLLIVTLLYGYREFIFSKVLIL